MSWWLLLLGCDPAAEAPAPVAPAVEAVADAHDVPMAPVAEPGLLTEAGFKALHTLREGVAGPPLRGTAIELAGSTAYLSMPPGPPRGGVVVIHEWWGLNDHIKRWTDRLAADGYAAIAVDLYAGTVATTRDQAMEAMKQVDQSKAVEILAAAHARLADPSVGARKRAVVGWCFGGGWALQHAIATPDLDAAVVYYGRLENDPAVLAKIHAPVLGVFGNRDAGIPPAAVDAFEAAMKAAGKGITIARFDADHAFANPSGEHYDEASAATAWEQVRAFLGAHLVDG